MLATLPKFETPLGPLSLFDELQAMPLGQQNFMELWFFLKHLEGAKSLLEIGCCEGRTSVMFARILGQGGKLCCMDVQSHRELPDNLEKAAAYGVDVSFAQGDSRSKEAIEWAEKNGPYHALFIDGSHRYEDVKADFENYKRMAPLIAFHDINHPDFGVRTLWNEILQAKPCEYVASSAIITGHYMGIGQLHRCEIRWVERDDIEAGNYQ